MKLTEGKIKSTELAEWFGIKPQTLRTTKEKRYEILKDYCDFEEVYGGVLVSEVYCDTYSKVSPKSIIKDKVKECWDESGLDTCSKVSKKIEPQLPALGVHLKSNTIYNYTWKGKNALWGKAGGQEGEIGYCDYLWAKEVNGSYEPLTEEEIKIKKEITHKFYGNVEDRVLFAEDEYKNNEISLEEYRSRVIGEVNYGSFMAATTAALGFTPVRVTQVFEGSRSAFVLVEGEFMM